jgi:surface-anchored protein
MEKRSLALGKGVISICVAVISVIALCLSFSSTRANSAPIELTAGHADAFQVKLENDELVLYFKDDTRGGEPVSRNPADVVMVARKEAKTTIPNSASFTFLGDPGAPVWILPQVQDPDLLWPGLSTETLTSDVWPGGQIDLTLISVEGPGDFYLFSVGSFGTVTQLWNLNDGLDTFSVDPGVHSHFNWAFTVAGDYTITVEASGTHPTLGTLSTGAVAYTIEVRSDATASTTESPQPTQTGGPTPTTGSAGPTPSTANPVPTTAGIGGGPPSGIGSLAPVGTSAPRWAILLAAIGFVGLTGGVWLACGPVGKRK